MKKISHKKLSNPVVEQVSVDLRPFDMIHVTLPLTEVELFFFRNVETGYVRSLAIIWILKSFIIISVFLYHNVIVR